MPSSLSSGPLEMVHLKRCRFIYCYIMCLVTVPMCIQNLYWGVYTCSSLCRQHFYRSSCQHRQLTTIHLQVHVLHQMFPSNSSTIEAAYSWKDALRWLQQIASALKYLHGLHPMVVHRDLKLENLLLTGSNPATADAKLADFGLCKLVKVS